MKEGKQEQRLGRLEDLDDDIDSTRWEIDSTFEDLDADNESLAMVEPHVRQASKEVAIKQWSNAITIEASITQCMKSSLLHSWSILLGCSFPTTQHRRFFEGL